MPCMNQIERSVIALEPRNDAIVSRPHSAESMLQTLRERVQADTKYTRVVTAEHEALIRRPLKALVEELDPDSFWPIHRSTIVNVAAIAGVTRNERARVVIRLKSRTERLPVSTAYEHLFRQM
jgi:DNA-binding LytR/AlgR family response regulator